MDGIICMKNAKIGNSWFRLRRTVARGPFVKLEPLFIVGDLQSNADEGEAIWSWNACGTGSNDGDDEGNEDEGEGDIQDLDGVDRT